MNLSNDNYTELKPEFDALEEAFIALGINYYMIGAVARNIWYDEKNIGFRTTKDIDFAVLIGNEQEYERVRQYLIEKKGFSPTRENAFALVSSTGTIVDILPFGEIADHGNVEVGGQGMTSIGVEGFFEVYEGGTETLKINTGHQFKVATLPAIILLKLIAYDDRPEKRQKDATDITNIIDNYFDLQTEFIYENHSDIFIGSEDEIEKMSLQELGAIVIGREIKRMAGVNPELLNRLISILKTQIASAESSAFLRNMVEESGETVDVVSTWLQRILQSLE